MSGTMTKLRLAEDLQLPAEIAGQTVALVGIRGSGKTNTAGVMAEELLDRHQPVVVLDPTDAWWGLRSGYPVFIFGGPHGDIPLAETDGKVLAEFVVTEQVPLILSLRHLRKNAQRRFVTEFCEELYHLKGRDEYRSPLTVFLDEASLFIPQRVLGEAARTVGAVEDLIARGRNSGFGVVLINQRPATINKDVLSQADTILSHRLTSPQDRKALAEWIEENATIEEYKSVLSSLATLKTGEAWVWAPSVDIIRRVQIRKRKTFDSSAAPKVGQSVTPPKKLADIDLDKLKGKLAATIEKAKADDPKELRRLLAQEREKNRKLEAAPAPKAEPTIKEVPVLSVNDVKTLEGLAQGLRVDNQKFVRALDEFSKLIEKVVHQPIHAKHAGNYSKIMTDKKAAPDYRKVQATDGLRTVAEWGKRFEASGHTAQKLGAGELKILTAVAQYPDGVTREQLTVLTGYKRSSRDTYLQRLSQAGEVMVNGGHIVATDLGRQVLGPDFEPLPTGDALQAYWLNRLSGGEQALFKILVGNYPASLDREKLSDHTGYKRSSRDTFLQRLQARQLIITDRGSVRASDVLFD